MLGTVTRAGDEIWTSASLTFQKPCSGRGGGGEGCSYFAGWGTSWQIPRGTSLPYSSYLGCGPHRAWARPTLRCASRAVC
jgi:hypothetical protein